MSKTIKHTKAKNSEVKIKPFSISIPDERLETIRTRVGGYDWSQLQDTGGWLSGVGIKDLQRLAKYWQNRYDWRKVEQHLNQQPHFIAEVEGEHIHFIHSRGDGSKPPLLLLHGWPGSFLEFEKLVAPLSADGHDVIVPSLPGFAFSKPITDIIGPRRAGEILHRLMVHLFGQSPYIVQGGDWGAHIASWMAHERPKALLGFHINMVSIFAGDVKPTSSGEKKFFSRRDKILDLETGYNHIQETRPQTLGAAMADSPVGAAAWILEKFGKWADLPKLADGSPDLWSKFSEEQLLTNIMLYIVPSSFVTATWIYRGKRLEGSDRFPAGTRIKSKFLWGWLHFPTPYFCLLPALLLKRHIIILFTGQKWIKGVISLPWRSRG